MPFVTKTDINRGFAPAFTPSTTQITAQRGAMTAVTADVALNAVGALLILPAGCVPVGVYMDGEGSPACDVGIINDAETALSNAAADGGGNWASALAANGAQLTLSKNMMRVLPSTTDRKVGVRFTTAGSAGIFGLTMLYRQT
jgi:hypothetical protein